MGLRATYLRVKNETDLTAILLLIEALPDVAGYDCGPFLGGFMEWKGKLFALIEHDGSSATHSYTAFSPTFSEFYYCGMCETQPWELSDDGSPIGVQYFGWGETEKFLKQTNKGK